MKDRLAEFLKQQGLTPGKLATLLEVQPSSISHLLSGRNKPGFEFIVKFLQCFPSVNPDLVQEGVTAGSVTEVCPFAAISRVSVA